ncbi:MULTISPECIES: TIGR02301 family protein [unclassified Beijerinckia]|uniref:TIGR02301 family protein n=1 Tax=unclassified Beijerinckia TaxID=2638183 RepID=UPI001481650A|nr:MULTISPECIES: TIGR02301 family protein [unclassified Beijerinckia]
MTDRSARLLSVALSFALVLASFQAGPLATGARAQQKPPAPAAPAPDTSAAPYERQLLRLSELLGALAFLRDLCGANDSAEWRRRMTALIEAEGLTEARKERLAGAFNRGFRGYEQTYRSCTPNAQLIIQRYLDEGQKIVREVSNRYGG